MPRLGQGVARVAVGRVMGTQAQMDRNTGAPASRPRSGSATSMDARLRRRRIGLESRRPAGESRGAARQCSGSCVQVSRPRGVGIVLETTSNHPALSNNRGNPTLANASEAIINYNLVSHRFPSVGDLGSGACSGARPNRRRREMVRPTEPNALAHPRPRACWGQGLRFPRPASPHAQDAKRSFMASMMTRPTAASSCQGDRCVALSDTSATTPALAAPQETDR